MLRMGVLSKSLGFAGRQLFRIVEPGLFGLPIQEFVFAMAILADDFLLEYFICKADAVTEVAICRLLRREACC